ncbi:UDP-N-acetylglucosamine 2-epimerase [Clostridium sp.]|uniref:UDP-N-acetylglucosamine 2-epimerase n=1 Tax=Clostridium sp. TaxID=1506 RepID=UPI002614DED7|nr:UDP-N-acetylglucosamine 2-epimerase [Clostridium sp.]
MKKNICVVTGTRAEYGLLKRLIFKLSDNINFHTKIVATGMHLSPEFGLTYKEIEKDGLKIDEKIEILLSSDTPESISKSMGLTIISFSEYFKRTQPDLIIILGDRYEILSVCCAAMNARIPIAHLYGGETTEGAIDECIRHAITKMSYLHFTSTEKYRNRVIQLGENPDRVFNVGALGVENILKTQLLLKSELEEQISFKLDKPYAVVTFHPVTLEENNVEYQFQQLLNACSKYKDMKFIFTKANSDANGRIINYMIDKYVLENSNSVGFESLGMLRYLSAVKYCSMVIGNSSSGIVEAPTFNIPTINIGNRQKGRLKVETIIDCEAETNEIILSIDKAKSNEFQEITKNYINIFGDGNTSERISKIIQEFLLEEKINLNKEFYDL